MKSTDMSALKSANVSLSDGSARWGFMHRKTNGHKSYLHDQLQYFVFSNRLACFLRVCVFVHATDRLKDPSRRRYVVTTVKVPSVLYHQ